MQLGDATVILLEQRQEILGEPVLILVRQRTHDAEIERDETRIGRARRIDPDIAGMCIGVEEIVAEHLRIEEAHAFLGEPYAIDAGRVERGKIVDRNAAHALERQHALVGVRPDHFGHVEIVRAEEIAPQQRRVGAFALQVELVGQRRLDLVDDFAWPDLVGVRMKALDRAAIARSSATSS